MAVQHVEINEVAEDQPVFPLFCGGGQFFHAIGVAFSGEVFVHAASVVNVVNFSNAQHAHLALS